MKCLFINLIFGKKNGYKFMISSKKGAKNAGCYYLQQQGARGVFKKFLRFVDFL